MPPLKSAPVNALTREFDALRARVQTTRGAGLWRALDELAASRGFDVWLRAEHPQLATMAAMNRSDFLRYAAASRAPGGIAACSRPQIGRAAWRERVCTDVLISVVAGTIKKKNKTDNN